MAIDKRALLDLIERADEDGELMPSMPDPKEELLRAFSVSWSDFRGEIQAARKGMRDVQEELRDLSHQINDLSKTVQAVRMELTAIAAKANG